MDKSSISQRGLRQRRKAEAKTYVETVLKAVDKRPPSLAKDMTAAGYPISASTIYRIIDDTDAIDPDRATIQKIEVFSGIPFDGAEAALGLAEDEAEPWQGPAEDTTAAAVAAFIEGIPGRDAWRLNTRAIELAGYRPGDIVVLDMNERPQPGDIVCAQVYDMEKMRAETIWRIFKGPYLIAASLEERHMTPRIVGSETAIKGVVIGLVRPRR